MTKPTKALVLAFWTDLGSIVTRLKSKETRILASSRSEKETFVLCDSCCATETRFELLEASFPAMNLTVVLAPALWADLDNRSPALWCGKCNPQALCGPIYAVRSAFRRPFRHQAPVLGQFVRP